MKALKYIVAGLLFGIIMTKSEAISWYRIQEMFRFHSFHLYGVIGSALAVGMTGLQLIKKYQAKTTKGTTIVLKNKKWSIPRYLIGGIIFGLGWAVTGACPGPVFVLLGHGYGVILAVLASALLGTLVYGIVRGRLPH